MTLNEEGWGALWCQIPVTKEGILSLKAARCVEPRACARLHSWSFSKAVNRCRRWRKLILSKMWHWEVELVLCWPGHILLQCRQRSAQLWYRQFFTVASKCWILFQGSVKTSERKTMVARSCTQSGSLGRGQAVRECYDRLVAAVSSGCGQFQDLKE